MGKTVDFSGQVAEAVDRAVAQIFAHGGPEEFQVLLRPEQRIAAGDPAEDHIDAVTEGHLPIVEQQHHRDRRSRLDDLREPRLTGLPG